jgi:ribosome biogenesis protein Nip4
VRIALADASDWSSIVQQIDSGFGEGVADKLSGGRVLVVLKTSSVTSFYLVPKNWLDICPLESEGFDPTMLGTWLGDVVRGEFRLALSILHHMISLTNRRIFISRHAAEAFTYGRSILRESVSKLEPGLRRGQQVLVLNTDEECLGLAELSVDASKLHVLSAHELVAKNLMDIGWYLRRFS